MALICAWLLVGVRATSGRWPSGLLEGAGEGVPRAKRNSRTSGGRGEGTGGRGWNLGSSIDVRCT